MRRLLSLLGFPRDQMGRDLDREQRCQLDRRRDDLMHSGLEEAEARRQAAIEFGGDAQVKQVKEEVRDTWLTRPCSSTKRV